MRRRWQNKAAFVDRHAHTDNISEAKLIFWIFEFTEEINRYFMMCGPRDVRATLSHFFSFIKENKIGWWPHRKGNNVSKNKARQAEHSLINFHTSRYELKMFFSFFLLLLSVRFSTLLQLLYRMFLIYYIKHIFYVTDTFKTKEQTCQSDESY